MPLVNKPPHFLFCDSKIDTDNQTEKVGIGGAAALFPAGKISTAIGVWLN